MNSPIGSLKEYRCTRNAPYRSPNCPGHTDCSARQGHYIYAQSREDALRKMALLFQNEHVYGFTAQPTEEE